MSSYEIFGEIVFELCMVLSFVAADEMLTKRKRIPAQETPRKG